MSNEEHDMPASRPTKAETKRVGAFRREIVFSFFIFPKLIKQKGKPIRRLKFSYNEEKECNYFLEEGNLNEN